MLKVFVVLVEVDSFFSDVVDFSETGGLSLAEVSLAVGELFSFSDFSVFSGSVPLLEYPSLYHPPPLRWNELMETWRSALFFPQSGHSSRDGSVNFWTSSNSYPQLVQRYS